MVVRAGVVWLGLLLLASMNGAAREALLIPRLGPEPGRAVSTVVLTVIVLLLTRLTIGWIGPRSAGDAWRIGVIWVTLTLAFEFLAGHFLFGNPWDRLLEDYDVRQGRIWVVVLIATLLAPRLMMSPGTKQSPPGH